MNIRYPIYEGVYRILTQHLWKNDLHAQQSRDWGNLRAQGN